MTAVTSVTYSDDVLIEKLLSSDQAKFFEVEFLGSLTKLNELAENIIKNTRTLNLSQLHNLKQNLQRASNGKRMRTGPSTITNIKLAFLGGCPSLSVKKAETLCAQIAGLRQYSLPSSEALRTCEKYKIDRKALQSLMIPVLKPGCKQVFTIEEGVEGQKIPRSILVDGDRAYLLLDQEDDGNIATPGSTHIPKLAIDLSTGKEAILQKVYIPKGKLGDYRRNKIDNEIRTAGMCNSSPFFPRLLSYVQALPSKVMATTPDGEAVEVEETFIIYEFRERGDLHHFIDKQPESHQIKEPAGQKLAMQNALQISYDIFRGLNFLHTKGYVHCDMKPSNAVLYEKDGRLRANIIDLESVTPIGKEQDWHTDSFLIKLHKKRDDDFIAIPQRDFLSTVQGLKELWEKVGLYSNKDTALALNACCVSMMKDPNGDYLDQFVKFASSQGVQLVQ